MEKTDPMPDQPPLSQQREEYRAIKSVRDIDIVMRALEIRTERAIADVFQQQARVVLAEMERSRAVFEEEAKQDQINYALNLAFIATQDGQISALAGPMLIAQNLGVRGMALQTGLNLQFNTRDPVTVDYMNRYAGERITGLNDVTRDRIQGVIKKDYAAGKTYAEMARDVRAEFDSMSRYRSKAIAVTEIHTAQGLAQKKTADELAKFGFQMEKRALTMKDEKVCPVC